MSLAPPTAGYLDAIFASIRSFARDLAAARAWTARAREAPGALWRFELFGAAQGSLGRARAALVEVEERLSGLGKPDEIPAPLDQLAKNLAAMRADLEAEEEDLEALERELMDRPLGEG